MSVNRGKQFEGVVKEAFEKVPHTFVLRLHDQTTGYLGSANICDFIVYNEPNLFLIECKSVHGNTFSFSNISSTQLKGLDDASRKLGVRAGILCWWIDHDVTKFIYIDDIMWYMKRGAKSMRYDDIEGIVINGTKKRVFFDYDMEEFINGI